ncbi:sorting nexin-29-like [Patiria miniata]|uniref:Sorting nexin-29 n=1 Tax=Patiria miniata TaxID=46514 RepID=A0A914AVD4_PATMI|nr:sorting nexin-29-like [Patiria miniata]
MEHLPQERQHLLDRLLDAVKQCQVRFGGRTELATDNDSRVSCLCAQFEAVLMHGLKRGGTNPLSALKQITGIPLIKPDGDQAFWPVVRENLTKHELQRYMSLKYITSDAGRARAWLRSTLNEHSLERYLHSFLATPDMLKQYYEPWSFLLDEERSSMIPTMARGLGSILFAINIDKEELNGTKQAPTLTSLIQTPEVVHSYSMAQKDPEPVYVTGTSTGGAKEKKEKKKKKKKGVVSIVSFNDDDSGSTVVSCGSPPSRLHHHQRPRKDSTGNKDSPPKTTTTQGGADRQTIGFDVPPSQSKPGAQTSAGLPLSNSTYNTESLFSRTKSLPDGDLIVLNESLPNLPGTTSSIPREDGDREPTIASQQQAYPDETSRNGSGLAQQSQPIPVQTGPMQNLTTQNPIPVTSAATNIPDRPAYNYGLDNRNLVNHTVQQLATSFPAKTPPPTPNSASFVQQYDHMRATLDAESVADRLRQQEVSPKTGSESSSFDADVIEGTPPKGSEVQDGSQLRSRQSFHIIGSGDDDSEAAMYPVNEDSASQQDTQSTDSSMLGFGAETENAAIGLLLAQKSFKESLQNTLDPSTPEDTLSTYQTMSNDELKQAVLAMMNRNDDLQEQNRSLRSLLDSEMEHTGNIRGHLEELKCSTLETEEKLQTQLGALTRENEVLKHQLKKYVGAVQLLRRDGSQAIEGLPGIRVSEPQPPIPEPKPDLNHSNQLEQYERKLIQVAEMHGELMEFNDYLSRQLKLRENIIQRLQNELIDLRGPLPRDQTAVVGLLNNGSDSDSLSSNQRALVNIWIPSAFLRGRGSDAYHVYQIYVRIRDEEWNVYRRYTEFRELHLKIRKNHAIVNTFDFPPKKAVGNKDSKFVEERRKKLQHYIRCVVNFYVDNSSELTENPCKERLLSVLPFFMDEPTRKLIRSTSVSRPNKLVAGRKPVPETPTYDGL